MNPIYRRGLRAPNSGGVQVAGWTRRDARCCLLVVSAPEGSPLAPGTEPFSSIMGPSLGRLGCLLTSYGQSSSSSSNCYVLQWLLPSWAQKSSVSKPRIRNVAAAKEKGVGCKYMITREIYARGLFLGKGSRTTSR